MKVQHIFSPLILLVFVFSNQVYSQGIIDQNDMAEFGLAQSLNNLQKFDQAFEILETLYAKYPENKKVTVEFAKALGYSKRFDRAAILLDNLERSYHKDNEIKRLYATVLESNGKFSEARNKYLYLLKQDPDNIDIKEKIADISSWISDYSTAIKYYKQVHDSKPQSLPLKTKLADVHYWSHNYSQAIQLYNELGINPKFDKDRSTNLGYAYMNLNKYAKSITIFRELAKIYPDDSEIKLAIANVLYASGDIEKAREEFKKIIEQDPDNIDIMLKFAELLMIQQKYGEAESICNVILQKEPDNRMARLSLARIMGWSRRYPRSIALYENIIKANPQWTLPGREKARVLGWSRKYKESIAEYKKILDYSPSNRTVRYEMLAKQNLYNRFDKTAELNYNKWLQLEPTDLEAMFDLGQIYSRQWRWSEAENMYQRILQKSPDHSKANQALKKVNIISNETRVRTGFEFVDADSSGRDIDKHYWNLFTSIKIPLNEHYYLRLRQDNFWYRFQRFRQIYQSQYLVALEYYDKPDFWASANYAYSDYPEEEGVRNTFGGEINFKPKDPWIVTLSHQREQIIDNGATFINKLYRDNYKIRGSYQPDRRLALAADYMYSNYSDDNFRSAYGIDLDYHLFYEPKSLKIAYRYEEYKFDKFKPTYFTPNSFHYQRIGLEWRHFLNKEELFWGDNDIFYTLGYAVNFDVKEETGHKVYFDFHRDWNDRFSTHLEWSKTIYEHRDTYSENHLMFYATFHF